MSRIRVKLISVFLGILGVALLVTEGVRAYNEGIYADTHGTAGRFDVLDGVLIIGGLLSLLLSLGLFDHVDSKLPRK